MSFAAMRRRRTGALGVSAGSGWRATLRPSPYAQPRFANGTAALDAYGRGTVLDTTYNLAGQTGAVRTCTTTAQMTTAIGAAVGGDIIVTAASLEAPAGGWSLPCTGKTGDVYIVSDYEYFRQFGGGTAFQRRPSLNDWSTLALSAIATEVGACRARTTDTYRTLYSNISSAGYGDAGMGPVFIATDTRTARRWWMAGLEIRPNPSAALTTAGYPCYNVIKIDYGAVTSDSQCAGNIVIDRCWVHAGATQSMRNAIWNNGSDVALINSCLTDCHELLNGDSHCYIQSSSGARSKIVNNTFHASSCVVIGGGFPDINTMPGDAEYRFNYHVTPRGLLTTDSDHSTSVYAGQSGWRSKTGGFEQKYGHRYLMEGNYFHLARGSHSFAVEMISVAQGIGFSYSLGENCTIRGVRIKDCCAGIYVAAKTVDFPSDPTQTNSRRYFIDEVLMTGIGNVDAPVDRRSLQVGPGADVILSAITADDEGALGGAQSALSLLNFSALADGPRSFSGLRLSFGQYGIVGPGTTGDSAVTAQQVSPSWSDVTLYGAAVSGASSAYNIDRTTTLVATRAAVGFTDPASGNYQIAGSTTTMNQALNDALCGSFLNVEGF